ncbi:DUF2147 domain-containing protein [Chitinophaga sp. GCM10012297]|uniref:DUF2147 domain-containing protein n=1 Tax=Chitinophaga chungangae TaxID=2821488 RepID=A0ABS3YIU6_9BACT|nr:DUF2147 domain-containing protein [Chitinophaga chungangae]MBO9154014.1 DUF2147 domain-containing protein [Chitinophaga chungangae]
MLLLMVPAFSFAQNADAVTGIWYNQEKDAKIQIYRSDKYFGKIVWIATVWTRA